MERVCSIPLEESRPYGTEAQVAGILGKVAGQIQDPKDRIKAVGLLLDMYHRAREQWVRKHIMRALRAFGYPDTRVLSIILDATNDFPSELSVQTAAALGGWGFRYMALCYLNAVATCTYVFVQERIDALCEMIRLYPDGPPPSALLEMIQNYQKHNEYLGQIMECASLLRPKWRKTLIPHLTNILEQEPDNWGGQFR